MQNLPNTDQQNKHNPTGKPAPPLWAKLIIGAALMIVAIALLVFSISSLIAFKTAYLS